MTDEASAPERDGEMGQVLGLLQVITALLVVIAIVLLVILARGPEDQERSAALVALVTATIAA